MTPAIQNAGDVKIWLAKLLVAVVAPPPPKFSKPDELAPLPTLPSNPPRMPPPFGRIDVMSPNKFKPILCL